MQQQLQCSLDMDAEPLYCAEQIRVPEVLPDILKQWTKEVIRQNPSDVLEFSARCGRAARAGALALRAPSRVVAQIL